MKICLDAGHYGKYNRSPAVKTYYESDMNWKLHLKLKAELEKYGIEVVTTRKEQANDMDLYDRGRCANGCDLFLSIHSNAVDNKVHEDIDYPVVYVPINGTGDELGKKLAECIASVMGTKQEGVCKSRKGSGDWDYYGVINGAARVGVPGLILEHSFHTNTRSTKWLMDDSNLDKQAKAEAEVIAKHYGLEIPAQQEVYRVISGAYTVRENADNKLATVRKSYPDAVLIRAGSYFKIQIAQYAASAQARSKLAEVKAKKLDCYISTDVLAEIVVGAQTVPAPAVPVYTRKQFITDLQIAIGAGVDGIAGPETLSKTPTLSRWVNVDHVAVRPVQRWLMELGYDEVGKADGIAGAKFDKAVKRFQKENGCTADGELTAENKTWRVMLGME